jgi:hypothetical protein
MSRRGRIPGLKLTFKPKTQLRYTRELVMKMHAEHLEGASFTELHRRHGYNPTRLRMHFQALGLKVNPPAYRPNKGFFQKTLVWKSDDEVRSLVPLMKRVMVHPSLKTEWREWPNERRQWWITMVREHLGPEHCRPPGPFSANVEPFQYGDANIMEWQRRQNAGKTSHIAGCKVKVSSQGVMWRNQVFFWVNETGYVEGLRWQPGKGRPALHRLIWEETHGPLPPGCVVRHKDGNPNNLDPENLYAATRNDVVRENQAGALNQKSAALTAQLLKLHEKKHTYETERLLGRTGPGSSRKGKEIRSEADHRSRQAKRSHQHRQRKDRAHRECQAPPRQAAHWCAADRQTKRSPGGGTLRRANTVDGRESRHRRALAEA